MARRSSARKINNTSQPVVFQAWPSPPSALSVRAPMRLTETTAELGHSSGRTAIIGEARGSTKDRGISVQHARPIAANIAKLPKVIDRIEKQSPKQVTRGFLSACLASAWLVAQLNTTS